MSTAVQAQGCETEGCSNPRFKNYKTCQDCRNKKIAAGTKRTAQEQKKRGCLCAGTGNQNPDCPVHAKLHVISEIKPEHRRVRNSDYQYFDRMTTRPQKVG